MQLFSFLFQLHFLSGHKEHIVCNAWDTFPYELNCIDHQCWGGLYWALMINRSCKFKPLAGKIFLWCIRTHLETISYALKTYCFEVQKGSAHCCLLLENRWRHPKNRQYQKHAASWVTNTLHPLTVTSDITVTFRRKNIVELFVVFICFMRRILSHNLNIFHGRGLQSED